MTVTANATQVDAFAFVFGGIESESSTGITSRCDGEDGHGVPCPYGWIKAK